jgi:AcrR family transcriptional regulator
MPKTPWGPSEALSAGRLKPIRGASGEVVRANQRERVLAATVACVAERGYAATAVADILRTSGLSRRTFYELFPDKAACLRATARELTDVLRARLARLDHGDPRETLRSQFSLLAEAVASQPAAAELLLLEAPAAGKAATEPLEDLLRVLERNLARAHSKATAQGEFSADIVAAQIGSAVEIARSRLRSGREDELPGLVDDFVTEVLAIRPPPRPLRLGVRAPRAEPEVPSAVDHRQRAINALAALAYREGYDSVRVGDILRQARMSSTTFYAHFDGKDDLMNAAVDSCCAQLVGVVVPAFSRLVDRGPGIRAGLLAGLNFLKNRPDMANLVACEVYAAGTEAIDRRNRGLARLATLFQESTALWTETSPMTLEILGGATFWALGRKVSRGEFDALPSMASVLTYLVLEPFFGDQYACNAANGVGVASEAESPPKHLGGTGPTLPPQSSMLDVLFDQEATAGELAEILARPIAEIERNLERLLAAGAIEPIGERRDGETAETVYSSMARLRSTRFITTESTERMTMSEREKVTAGIWDLISGEVDSAIAAGVFDARPARALIRVPIRIDEAGWQELDDIHDQTLYAVMEVQKRSRRRLRESGSEGFEVRSLQITFEMPDPAERP